MEEKHRKYSKTELDKKSELEIVRLYYKEFGEKVPWYYADDPGLKETLCKSLMSGKKVGYAPTGSRID
ncbi:MAG: hypothetical protein PUF91_03345 [Lactobacillus delbrueckii]|nr:hypothetical protein [Lactobacillus delbrueckii]